MDDKEYEQITQELATLRKEPSNGFPLSQRWLVLRKVAVFGKHMNKPDFRVLMDSKGYVKMPELEDLYSKYQNELKKREKIKKVVDEPKVIAKPIEDDVIKDALAKF